MDKPTIYTNYIGLSDSSTWTTMAWVHFVQASWARLHPLNKRFGCWSNIMGNKGYQPRRGILMRRKIWPVFWCRKIILLRISLGSNCKVLAHVDCRSYLETDTRDLTLYADWLPVVLLHWVKTKQFWRSTDGARSDRRPPFRTKYAKAWTYREEQSLATRESSPQDL